MKAGALAIFLLGSLMGSPALAAPATAIEYPAEPVNVQDMLRRQAELSRPVTLDIALTGAGVPLWSGSLRVTHRDRGEFSQNSQQALEACPGELDGTSRYGSMQSRLQLAIMTTSVNDAGQVFRVTANWTRPERQCGEASSQKTVAFEQTVTLAPGETRALTGDAGFVVRLTRRR